jgi:hypothetical protein
MSEVIESNFTAFKTAVARQWERMQKHGMFRVAVEKDDLWTTYLGSFPAGSNPIFRERTEHDCTCCKQFIRAVGDCVAVIDGKLVSVWDAAPADEPAFEVVCKALAALVKSKPIASPFLHFDRTAGTDRNFEQMTEGTKTWSHFFVNIDKKYVAVKSTIPTTLGEKRAQHDVLLRSLTEITDESIDTVLDLIAQNSLYRGDEHKAAVLEFQKVKREFAKLTTDTARDLFVWSADTFGSVSRMRNTVIGTLLVDLSTGVDIEHAVKSFESKVAPTNYKRPTALITAAMITKAKEKLTELGLTSALDRRYATLRDITVNNILFANRSARKTIAGDVFDTLTDQVGTKSKNFDKVEEVPIATFLADILPRAESVEVLLENRHQGNLVSLIAPSDPTAGALFKWDNGFSWSYSGEVTDAIKERVKQAGGNVTGDLCCRLAWHNYDDLDFHMVEPGGHEISFRSKQSPYGGRLDVDMNAGGGQTREPVENIFYGDRGRMREGVYHLFVQQWSRRETSDVGFEVEVDYLGTVHRFAYEKAVAGDVTVAKFKYTHAGGFEIIESLPSSQAVRNAWGLPTQIFHPVNVLMLSPNHWDDKAVGNKHYFFMLDGCANDGTARGFYNEFLKGELDVHRKVLEVVGSKMKPVDSVSQLSGLGFSSTQKNTLVCRVKGAFTRDIRVTF